MDKGVMWILAAFLVAIMAGLSGMAHSLGEAAPAAPVVPGVPAQAAGAPGRPAPEHSAPYEQLLRLHVVANSDTPEDQAVKREVRDAVLALLAPALNRSRSVEEAKQVALARQEEVRRAAQGVVRRAGKSYGVKVEVGRFLFPTKVYGDVALPAGRYDALRIALGRAEGQNWWCVLFPPLCLVDAAGGVAVLPAGHPAGEVPDPWDGASTPEDGSAGEQGTGEWTPASTSDAGGQEPPLQVRYALLEWLKRHPLNPRLTAWLEARGWRLAPDR